MLLEDVRDWSVEVGGGTGGLRRAHLLATEYQLSELEADFRAVDGRGYHG